MKGAICEDGFFCLNVVKSKYREEVWSETVNNRCLRKARHHGFPTNTKRCRRFVFPEQKQSAPFCIFKTAHLILYKIIFCYKAIYILQQTKGLAQ